MQAVSEKTRLVSLEALHFALVLFCLLKHGEGAEIAVLAGGGVLFTRVQAVLTGFEFANHG